MGYHQRGGVYRHPRRKVIFLGDLIDRGPRIRLAVQIARRMVEEGEAHIVMGNHEYNALAYGQRAPAGLGREWLREHTPRNNRIINETLEQYRDHPQEWEEALAWFLEIPLFLERDGLRVVHACWDQPLIDDLRKRRPDACMDEAFLVESTAPGTRAFEILDRLTRGTQMPLPLGVEIHSGDGFTRRSFRTHFWARAPQTWGDVVFQPDNLPGDLGSGRSPPRIASASPSTARTSRHSSSGTTGARGFRPCRRPMSPAWTTARSSSGGWWPTAGAASASSTRIASSGCGSPGRSRCVRAPGRSASSEIVDDTKLYNIFCSVP